MERRTRSSKFEPGLASRGVVLVVCRRFAPVSFSPRDRRFITVGVFDPSSKAIVGPCSSPTHFTRVGTIVAAEVRAIVVRPIPIQEERKPSEVDHL